MFVFFYLEAEICLNGASGDMIKDQAMEKQLEEKFKNVVLQGNIENVQEDIIDQSVMECAQISEGSIPIISDNVFTEFEAMVFSIIRVF